MPFNPRARRRKAPRSAVPKIVGVPRRDKLDRPRGPGAQSRTPLPSGAVMVRRGVSAIVYPHDGTEARARFRKRCRRFAVMADGIGEPLGAGAAGPYWAAYRCVALTTADMDAFVASGAVRAWHFDCPVQSDGLPRAYVPADGVDVRRLPPPPREARRVKRVDERAGETVLAAPIAHPIGLRTRGADAAPAIVTRPPGRPARAKPSRSGELANNPAAGFVPSTRLGTAPAAYRNGAVSAWPRGTALPAVPTSAGPSYPPADHAVWALEALRQYAGMGGY